MPASLNIFGSAGFFDNVFPYFPTKINNNINFLINIFL